MSQTTPRAIAFKITAIVLVAYFTFAAVVYHNDTDAMHWVLFYMICALCCLLTVLRKDSLPLLYVAIGMGIIEIASTADGFLTLYRTGADNLSALKEGVDKSYFNLRRDFFGAMVAILVCLCLAIRLRRAVVK